MQTSFATLKGDKLDQSQIVLEPTLVLRESTAPLKNPGELIYNCLEDAQ